MAQAQARLRIKRVYEPASPADGTRILVDRLWPRGLKKADAAISQWMKDIAPSPQLRTWFGHDPARWDGFRDQYRAELNLNRRLLDGLRQLTKTGPVTLLYAAHDVLHNHAAVLRDVLLEEMTASRSHGKPASTRTSC